MRLVIGKVGELQGATKICLSVKKPGEVAGVTGRGAAPSSSGGFSTLEKHCGGVSFSINFFILGKGRLRNLSFAERRTLGCRCRER